MYKKKQQCPFFLFLLSPDIGHKAQPLFHQFIPVDRGHVNISKNAAFTIRTHFIVLKKHSYNCTFHVQTFYTPTHLYISLLLFISDKYFSVWITPNGSVLFNGCIQSNMNCHAFSFHSKFAFYDS